MQRLLKKPTKALTLIELILVLAILVILAGLLLPKLDTFSVKANKGVAASNMTDISRFVQQYRIQNVNYPDGWDSLIDTDSGGLWTAATSTGNGLDPQLVGGPVPGSPTKLATSTIADVNELRSLARVGITRMYDLDATTATEPAGDAFIASRTLAVGDTYATVNAMDGDGQAIIAHMYPQTGTVPTDKKLIVLGLGPRNDMLGTLLQEVPFYSNTPPNFYNRFLAVFALDTGGGRAELRGIFGADADRIDEEITEYYEN